MGFEIAKLKFTSPLHLARGQSDYSSSLERLHSDTLKSAIFSAARLLFGDLITDGQSDDLSPFMEAFTVSSAFPYFGDEFFFPRPAIEFDLKTQELSPKAKKKIEFFGKSIFERVLQGEKIILEETQLWHDSKYASDLNLAVDQGKPYSVKEKKEFDLISSEVFQHVMVPRAGDNDASTYYMERLRFKEEGGLFFLIEFADPENADKYRKLISAALNILGEEGIGSDRSTGNGQFEFKGFEHLDLKVPAQSNYVMNLSLYCPTRAECTEELVKQGYHQMIRRGGYIAFPDDYTNATLRKKPVYFFAEGGLFPKQKEGLKGKLMNVRPIAMQGHPVWRDGRSIFIPVNHKIPTQ